jgi:protein-S-isoprenylcysteine O-methyltransferase Ste14
MSPSSLQQRKWLGTLLVTLQFGLLIGLAMLAAPKALNHPIPLGVWAAAGAAMALAAWTLIYNRPGNFNIRPTPKSRGSLITTGPYRHIRHPMYTSVLLGGGSLAWLANPITGWLAWTALALVLVVKSSLEERWMCEQHHGYGAYVQRSKRFLPCVI